MGNQHHQQQQKRESAPEAVILEGAEVEFRTIHETPGAMPPNGSAGFQIPQVMSAVQFAQIGVGTQRVVDTVNPAGLNEFLATQADLNGFHLQASRMRNRPIDPSLGAGFSRTMSRNVQVKHIVYLAAGGLALFLIWEGIAYKWDLPRAGLFDPTDPIKALKK